MSKKIKEPIEEQKVDNENLEPALDMVSVLKDQLARALADYDNLRKRTDEEKQMWVMFASTKIVNRLLPIYDAINEAQKHLNDQGLAIVTGEFRSLLKEEGLEEINPKMGEDYNNDLMEVVDTIDTENENMDGKVESTVLSGWRFRNEKVVRHAKVKVFRNK